MKKTVIYFHSLSSPWAYMGWPRFRALIEKHNLDVIVRPTRIVPPNGGIPLLSRPDARRRYHEVELDRWRKRLKMPLAKQSRVYHGVGEYARGSVHTNTVEGFFSIFKRGMRGIYQHCAEKHLHRYLAEFDFRYSNRVALGFNDADRTDAMVKGIIGKRLTYKQSHVGA